MSVQENVHVTFELLCGLQLCFFTLLLSFKHLAVFKNIGPKYILGLGIVKKQHDDLVAQSSVILSKQLFCQMSKCKLF